MGHGNREKRNSRKMRKSNSLNRIAQMSDATSNAPHSVERDGSVSKRRRILPAPRVARQGVRREAAVIVV